MYERHQTFVPPRISTNPARSPHSQRVVANLPALQVTNDEYRFLCSCRIIRNKIQSVQCLVTGVVISHFTEQSAQHKRFLHWRERFELLYVNFRRLVDQGAVDDCGFIKLSRIRFGGCLGDTCRRVYFLAKRRAEQRCAAEVAATQVGPGEIRAFEIRVSK